MKLVLGILLGILGTFLYLDPAGTADTLEKYASEGFISYTSDVTRGPGWTAYSEVWYRDDGMGRAIVVGEGASVQNAYGYDVTLTTTYGPLTTYYDYISFLSRY